MVNIKEEIMTISYVLHKVFEIYGKAMEERKQHMLKIKKSNIKPNQILFNDDYTYNGYAIITPNLIYKECLMPFI